MNQEEKDRFMRGVEISEECWVWKKSLSTPGYGQYWVNGKNKLAHKVSYEMHVGIVPKGMTLDHLCRNRACVNPKHLEVVTMRENILRGVGRGAINARKTHCEKGHILEGENLVNRESSRQCKECSNRKYRERYLRNAEEFRRRRRESYYRSKSNNK